MPVRPAPPLWAALLSGCHALSCGPEPGLTPSGFPSLQVEDLSECVGSALIQKGFKAAPDQFIGIFSQNRPEVTPSSYRVRL